MSVRRRPERLTGRFARSRSGASAAEFALVATPFFFMLFAIMEVGLVFVIDSTLENATVEAGRLIRTGQADERDITAAQFKTEICNRMSIFVSGCSAKLSVDVRELTQFRNANPPDPTASGSFSENGLTYVTGQPGSLMLVRSFYRHTLITPFLQQGLSRVGNTQAVLTGSTAFRNEPYNT